MNGWMDGRMDRRADVRIDGWIGEWKDIAVTEWNSIEHKILSEHVSWTNYSAASFEILKSPKKKNKPDVCLRFHGIEDRILKKLIT